MPKELPDWIKKAVSDWEIEQAYVKSKLTIEEQATLSNFYSQFDAQRLGWGEEFPDLEVEEQTMEFLFEQIPGAREAFEKSLRLTEEAHNLLAKQNKTSRPS